MVHPAIAGAVLWGALFVTEGRAQRVWIVAPNPGPRVDFTAIQPAVDAAVDGDMVLVRPGTYDAFTIDGKALVVAADGGRVVLNPATSGLNVSNIAPHQSVVVRGFALGSAGSTPLHVSQCWGPVTIEDSQFATVRPVITHAAGHFTLSSRVTLIRCTLTGGSTWRRINIGFQAFDSALFLHDCTVRGGAGDSLWPGAPGAILYGSTLSAFGTTFVGGVGDAGTAFGSTCLYAPSDGGPALQLAGSPCAAALVDCTLVPGPAGYAPPGCPPARPGARIAGSGAVVEVDGPDGSLTAPSPVRAGGTATLTFRGAPGFDVWLVAPPDQSPLFSVGCHGAIHPQLATGFVLRVGTMPQSGTTTLQLPVPADLTASGVPLFFQAALTSPAFGCFVGSPTALLVVASTL